jgi:ketosteroid isomerase-like protein
MKIPWAALVVASALFQLGCGARPAGFSAEDEAAVRRTADSAVAYLRAGNAKGWAGIWAEDGVLQPPNHQVVRGRAALQDYAQAMLPIENMVFTDVQVQGAGDLAYGTSGFVFNRKGEPADTGKQLWVSRRNRDGRWEVTVVSFNSDLAPPPRR